MRAHASLSNYLFSSLSIDTYRYMTHQNTVSMWLKSDPYPEYTDDIGQIWYHHKHRDKVL